MDGGGWMDICSFTWYVYSGTDKWLDGWMDGWMDTCSFSWYVYNDMNLLMDRWMNLLTCTCLHVFSVAWMDRLMDEEITTYLIIHVYRCVYTGSNECHLIKCKTDNLHRYIITKLNDSMHCEMKIN